MKMFLNWFVSSISILIAAYLLPGVTVESFLVALVVAVVLGFINGFLRPLLLILTLPLTIVTLGLFAFVLNALLIWAASAIVPGFDIANFWWALLFSVALSLINMFFRKLQRDEDGS